MVLSYRWSQIFNSNAGGCFFSFFLFALSMYIRKSNIVFAWSEEALLLRKSQPFSSNSHHSIVAIVTIVITTNHRHHRHQSSSQLRTSAIAHTGNMPPKKPIAKPRAGLRRGAAAAAEAGSSAIAEGVAETTAEPAVLSSSVTSNPKETKPIPPPRGRLDSLSSSASFSAATRTPAGSLLSRRPAKLKFQPKHVQRRTKE